MRLLVLFLTLTKVGIICRPSDIKEKFSSAFDQIQWNNEHSSNSDSNYPEGLFEDDIVKSPGIEELVHQKITSSDRQRRDVRVGSSFAWPNGKVPYVFAEDYPYWGKYLVRSAMDEIQKLSCVKFVERQNENDYVKIFDDKKCYSSIGRIGSNQSLSLGENCLLESTIQHELFHALGFFHEQSRLERDSFVTIHWDNIQKGKESNFQKYKIGEASHLDEEYDKKSIMHYSNYIFAKDKKKMTISSKSNPSEFLGGFQMTDIDVRQLNKLYNCPCVDHIAHCQVILNMCSLLRTNHYCQKSCGFCQDTSAHLTTTTTTPTTTTTTTTTIVPSIRTTSPTTTISTTTYTTTPTMTSTTTMTTSTTTPTTPTKTTTATMRIPTTSTLRKSTLTSKQCINMMPCCANLAANGLCQKSGYVRSICVKSCNIECKPNATDYFAATTTTPTPFFDQTATPSSTTVLFASLKTILLSLSVCVKLL